MQELSAGDVFHDDSRENGWIPELQGKKNNERKIRVMVVRLCPT